MGGDCSTLKSCNVSRHHHTHSLAHSTRLCRFRAVSHRPMRRLPVRPILTNLNSAPTSAGVPSSVNNPTSKSFADRLGRYDAECHLHPPAFVLDDPSLRPLNAILSGAERPWFRVDDRIVTESVKFMPVQPSNKSRPWRHTFQVSGKSIWSS